MRFLVEKYETTNKVTDERLRVNETFMKHETCFINYCFFCPFNIFTSLLHVHHIIRNHIYLLPLYHVIMKSFQLNFLNEPVPVKHQRMKIEILPLSCSTSIFLLYRILFPRYVTGIILLVVRRLSRCRYCKSIIDCLCHEFPVHFLAITNHFACHPSPFHVQLPHPETINETHGTAKGLKAPQTCHLINVICFIPLNYFAPGLVWSGLCLVSATTTRALFCCHIVVVPSHKSLAAQIWMTED